MSPGPKRKWGPSDAIKLARIYFRASARGMPSFQDVADEFRSDKPDGRDLSRTQVRAAIREAIEQGWIEVKVLENEPIEEDPDLAGELHQRFGIRRVRVARIEPAEHLTDDGYTSAQLKLGRLLGSQLWEDAAFLFDGERGRFGVGSGRAVRAAAQELRRRVTHERLPGQEVISLSGTLYDRLEFFEDSHVTVDADANAEAFSSAFDDTTQLFRCCARLFSEGDKDGLATASDLIPSTHIPRIANSPSQIVATAGSVSSQTHLRHFADQILAPSQGPSAQETSGVRYTQDLSMRKKLRSTAEQLRELLDLSTAIESSHGLNLGFAPCISIANHLIAVTPPEPIRSLLPDISKEMERIGELVHALVPVILAAPVQTLSQASCIHLLGGGGGRAAGLWHLLENLRLPIKTLVTTQATARLLLEWKGE